jgi:hypothetical protein
VFYNYPFPSQPDPIPASLMPNFVTSAPNIDYPSGANDMVGIQMLAQANVSFAIRFSGANANSPRRPRFRSRNQPSGAMPGSAGRISGLGSDFVIPF